MNNYENAGSGLKKLYIAEIGVLVCTVLAFIPIINILAGIGMLVFAIMSLVGLFQAGKDISGCMTAFVLTLVSGVCNVLKSIGGSVGTVASIVGPILSFLVMYFVCTSVAEVMNNIQQPDIAQKGQTVWKISLGCTIASVVILLLAFIPAFSGLATIGTIIVAIISIINIVLFMMFLGNSSAALGA